MQVQQHLDRGGMHPGEVRPQHPCGIRGEDERRAVKALLARFRPRPPEEQRQVPSLLNGLGKLQVGVGDFAHSPGREDVNIRILSWGLRTGGGRACGLPERVGSALRTSLLR